MQSKYINLATVVDLTTLSKSRIYALMALGLFPRNGKLKDTPKRVVWLHIEVEEYLDQQFERTNQRPTLNTQ